MTRSVTVVIPSYKSSKKILKHVKNISKKTKIIIVENSQNKKLKDKLEKKNKNVKVILRNNIGYGNAINHASKLIKTKYFFAINPDTKIYKNTITLLLNSCKKIKKFGAVSPNLKGNKNKYKKKNIVEQETLTGGAMLFNTKIFKKLNGFDKNIFLYYEDNDYFTKCRLKKYKLFLIINSYHFHKKRSSGSAIFKNKDERDYAYYLSGWHGQWSKFYYYKKYFGYLTSLKKCLPSLIINFFQMILNLLINPKKTKYTYFKIEGLLVSIFGYSSYKRSKYDKPFSL